MIKKNGILYILYPIICTFISSLFCLSNENSILADDLKLHSKFHLVTVASYREIGLDLLEKSCEKFSLNLKILGMGQAYACNKTKLYKVREYIKNIPDEDVLMFVDAFDVIMLANEDKILKRFHEMQAPFIITCDLHCWPLAGIKNKFPKSPTPFRFINSGCYIGYVGAIKKILNNLPYNAHSISDQAVFSKHFVNNKHLYKLDYFCQVALNLHWMKFSDIEISIPNFIVKCKQFEKAPLVVQGNGPDGRKLLHTIWRKLFPDYFRVSKFERE